MKKIIKISLFTILSLVLIFGFVVLRLFLVRSFDLNAQEKHLDELKIYYDSSDYQKIDENQFVNFDLDDTSIHLNDIQMIASHNSYKKKGPAIGRFFVGLGDSFEEAKALKYGYKNITEQLELGIRSFELDIRYRNEKFELTHVPLVDPSSQAIDFEMLLEEIYLFSSHQDKHMPIIFLIEIKNDWMVLDPMLEDMDQDVFLAFDDLIKDQVKDHLFTPSDMLLEGKSLKEVITDHGWPNITDLFNKVMFVLHPDSYNQIYYDNDQTLRTQSMFIGSYYSENPEDYASFFVQNNVDQTIIKSLVDQNYIVRTRIDEQLIFNASRYLDAIESGAQILTSDFSVGRSDLNAQ
jgi:calcium-dependent phosphoinositide phospholipase C